MIKETGGHHAKMGMIGTVICFEDFNGVRFDEEFECGHSLGGRCERGHGQWMKDTDIELIDGHKDDHKIVITTDGKNTLARLYENGKVIKTAEAKCSPSDTFDFETGAKLAFERLTAYDYVKAKEILSKDCGILGCDKCKLERYAKSKGTSCWDIANFGKIDLKEYSPEYLDNLIAELEKFEEKEKEKYDYNKAHDILYKYCSGVRCEDCIAKKYAKSIGKSNCLDVMDLEKVSNKTYTPVYLDDLISKLEKLKEKEETDEFIPHLESDGEHCGQIGKETKYVDAVGRKLCVGDVVEHFDENGMSFGDTVIVEQALGYRANKVKQFVMGIESCCNDENGSIGEGWKIIKKRSFDDVKNGEEIGFIKFIK